MADKGSKEHRTKLDDWLWRLDSIEQEMKRVIPASNLHTVLTCSYDWRQKGYNDPAMDTVWFRPRYREDVPFFIGWDPSCLNNDPQTGLSVHETSPKNKAVFPKPGDDWRSGLAWAVLYNVDGEVSTGLTQTALQSLDRSATEAFRLAPSLVQTKLGQLGQSDCWPEVLLYLAIEGLHPNISAFSQPVLDPNDVAAVCGSIDALGNGISIIGLTIQLYRDFRTATSLAFELFRQAVQDTSDASDSPKLGIAQSGAEKGVSLAGTPLSAKACAVLELLKALPAHRGMTGPEILDALMKRNPPMLCDQSTLTRRIIPKLKPYGVKNKRGAGYYIDPIDAPQ